MIIHTHTHKDGDINVMKDFYYIIHIGKVGNVVMQQVSRGSEVVVEAIEAVEVVAVDKNLAYLDLITH